MASAASVLDLSASQQAGAVACGEISASELVQAAIDRAEHNQKLGPFACLDGETALATAAGIDAERSAGHTANRSPALAGVPYAIKDLALACAGLPFTCGSRLFGDYVPDFDSAAAARAKAAGLVILGTTVSCEFGLMPVTEPLRFGPARNPWNPGYTAGGSSGGSAVAVAAGVVPIASASDAGGSIRIPAACCGLVGLKPSRGRTSLAPLMGEHFFACEGVLSRSVEDTALMLDILAGPEPGDSSWAPPPQQPFAQAIGNSEPLRIGLVLDPPFDTDVDPQHRQATLRIAGLLQSLGHHVEEAASPWHNPAFPKLFGKVWMVGAGSFAGWAAQVSGMTPGPDTLEPITLAFAERAAGLPAAEYAGLMIALQAYARAVVAASSPWNAILSPALAQRPLPVGSFDGEYDPDEVLARVLAFTPYTPVANITGQPAISLPAGLADDGMPLAVQLLGRPLGEATLLRLAAELEQAQAWPQTRPATPEESSP